MCVHQFSSSSESSNICQWCRWMVPNLNRGAIRVLRMLNENHLTVWIWTRSGRARGNKNIKVAGWKSKNNKMKQAPPWNCWVWRFYFGFFSNTFAFLRRSLIVSVTRLCYPRNDARTFQGKYSDRVGTTSGKLPDDVNPTWHKGSGSWSRKCSQPLI